MPPATDFLNSLDRMHSALSMADMHVALRDALRDDCGGAAYSIFYLDEERGELHLSYASEDALLNGEAPWPGTEADLLAWFRERRLGPVQGNGDWPADLRPMGSAPLRFQDHDFGLLLLHGPATLPADGDAALAFAAISRAAAIELVRLQLYDAANGEAQAASAKISAINSTSDLLKNLDLETLLNKLMDLSLGIMNAQVGSIMLLRDDGLESEVEYGLRHEIMAAIKTADGGSFIEQVFAGGEPVLIHDMGAREDLDLSALDVNLQSLISIPLVTKTSTLGLINIVNTESEFNSADFEILTTVSNLAASAVENAILQAQALDSARMKEQLQIARSIQTALLPRSAPEVLGFEIAGWSIACDETGGDYFDYVQLDDDRMAVVVGDASGHGLGAALMMLIARSSLRTLLQNNSDLAEVFHSLNNRVEADSEDDKFMTLFCGVVNLKARTFSYSSAGHEGPMWFSPSRDFIEELPSTGMPLGVIADVPFDITEEHALQVGDVLVMATDGVWEAMNDKSEEYGKERLIKLIQANITAGARELLDKVHADVMDFISSTHQRDDITLVIGKVI